MTELSAWVMGMITGAAFSWAIMRLHYTRPQPRDARGRFTKAS